MACQLSSRATLWYWHVPSELALSTCAFLWALFRAVQHLQYLASSSSREDAIRAEKVNLQQQLETAKAATQL